MNFEYIIKNLKNRNNGILYIILIIGIALMLFPSKKESTVIKQTDINDQDRLREIITKIKGVKKADVMITYYGSSSSNIVYDIRTRGEETERKAVISNGNAVVTGENYPRVKGVVVTVKGVRINDIKNSIADAVTVALDIPKYKVIVLESG